LGEVGVGTSSPLGQLHVKEGSSGASSARSGGDTLVIEDSDNVGLTLLGGQYNNANIYFGDQGDNNEGLITYGRL